MKGIKASESLYRVKDLDEVAAADLTEDDVTQDILEEEVPEFLKTKTLLK